MHCGLAASVIAHYLIKQQQRQRDLRNGDYFVIISSSSHPLFLTERAINRLAVEVNIENARFAVVCSRVVKTLNSEISRCYLADYVKELN